MKPFAPFRWFRDIPIANKLYFTVGVMALLIAFELFMLFFSIHTLSSVRAFVGGEGLWSKSQKNAIYHLRKYAHLGRDEEYREFLGFLKVPLGDSKARMEMLKESPDYHIIQQGFLEGRNHPDDIDGMIKLFRRFHSISYINKAISVWTEADSIMLQLQKSANEIHLVMSKFAVAPPETVDQNLLKIDDFNKKLTILEDEFSGTLGEGSRWLENLILKILFVIALTVEVSGLLLTISVSRNIAKGINGIIIASVEVAKGNFKNRATVYSKDEIGLLTNSFNKMTSDLEKNVKERILAEMEIKQKSEELIRSNKELEQFAYVASHDLQEPLRIITSFVQLLENKYKNKLDEEAGEYIKFTVDAAGRMYALINDLLAYSRVGTGIKIAKKNSDCNNVIKTVLKNLKASIEETNANIIFKELPFINADELQMVQLFQNIIANAIKFKGEKNPEIKIEAKDNNSHWLFLVSDNGIGIQKEYLERIFVIFQRLHTIAEYSGTGIGLAISKKIVEHHGGRIWVESELGKGTTFYFTIQKL